MEKKSAVKRTQGEAQAKNGTSAGRDTGSRPLANSSYPRRLYAAASYMQILTVQSVYPSALYI